MRIVEGSMGVWLELGEGDDVLRMARPKCRLVLHLLPIVREWAQGGTPVGSQRDVRWAPSQRMRTDVLEVRASDWKPLRLTRPQARALVSRIEDLRRFVGTDGA